MIDDTTTQDMFDLLDRAEGKSLPASAASPATESETPTVESTSAVETEDQPASGTSAPAPVTAEPDSASSAGRDPFSVDTVPGLGSDTAGSLPETSDVRVFSGLDELFAPHDWGDVPQAGQLPVRGHTPRLRSGRPPGTTPAQPGYWHVAPAGHPRFPRPLRRYAVRGKLGGAGPGPTGGYRDRPGTAPVATTRGPFLRRVRDQGLETR